MSDLEIIKKIEDKYNIQFKRVEKVDLGKSTLEYSVNNLNQVEALSLFGCDFDDYFFLQELQNLTVLDLSYNQISDYFFLFKLKGLTSLSLSSNQILDISILQELHALTTLDLSFNLISNISFLQDLTSLTTLDLSYNQISNYSFLQKLKSLTNLGLSQNQISDISFLQELKSLIVLDLKFNQISDIFILQELKNLTVLDLRSNRITELPLWITNFNMEVVWEEYSFKNLNLYNNPIQHPPIAIVKQGKEAIKNYFNQLEKDTASYLYETKLLIIGEGGTGKTSFAVKMINKNAELPNDNDTTLGIEVRNWKFAITDINRRMQTFYTNLWDFGGQKLYQGTHQIFFNSKALYVLLDDAREEKTDFGYWLNTVEQLAGKESKVLIVTNKKNKHTPQIDENGLKARFGKIIEGFVSLDLKNDIDKIMDLQNKIKYILQRLPDIGDQLPTAWVKIREELFSIDKDYISLDYYIEICEKYNLVGKDKLDYLSEYYNRIGVFTHYYDNPILKNRVYLNSNWLLKTVYKVLYHEIVKNEINKGIISEIELKEIWKDIDIEIDNLTELMNRFGLMYEINNKYVIPAHLPNEQPYKVWEFDSKKEILQFAYEFDKYMPRGILPRLIVALNGRIYNQNLVWNKGFNIKFENTYAEIKETYELNNTFLIRIYGTRKKELLGIINNEFDKLLKNFKTQPEKLVPCICNECKVNKKPYFYKYSMLEKYKNNSIELIRCEDSFKEVDVSLLLDGIGRLELENFEKRIIDEIKINREKVKKNTYKIISKIDNRFDELVALSNSNKDDIVNVVGKFNANQTKELATKLISVSEQLLKTYKGKDLEKYKTYLQETKNSSNWETKLKLSIPFIKLIGIDISTEVKFNLVNWIKTNYKKYEDDIYEIMGVTNTKQFREQKRD